MTELMTLKACKCGCGKKTMPNRHYAYGHKPKAGGLTTDRFHERQRTKPAVSLLEQRADSYIAAHKQATAELKEIEAEIDQVDEALEAARKTIAALDARKIALVDRHALVSGTSSLLEEMGVKKVEETEA